MGRAGQRDRRDAGPEQREQPPAPGTGPAEQQRRDRCDRAQRDDEGRHARHPHQRNDGDSAERGAGQVHRVQARDVLGVGPHGERDRDPAGQEHQRRQRARRRQSRDEAGRQRAVDREVQAHQQQRQDDEQDREDRRPAHELDAHVAAEPRRAHVHRDRARPRSEQRERDRQEREVVEERRREQAREQHLKGQDAAGHQSHPDADPEGQPLAHRGRQPTQHAGAATPSTGRPRRAETTNELVVVRRVLPRDHDQVHARARGRGVRPVGDTDEHPEDAAMTHLHPDRELRRPGRAVVQRAAGDVLPRALEPLDRVQRAVLGRA